MTTGGLSLVGTAPTCGEATRARPSVVLAAFHPGGDVHLVDFDRADKIEGRRIERFSEALDTPVQHSIGDVEFGFELANTHVEPKERVDGEEPLGERDLRAREDRAGLVVEGAVTILTEIPLKRSVAAILDHRLRLAAWTPKALTPADLLQQVRGAHL